jgi:hypothetical protein
MIRLSIRVGWVVPWAGAGLPLASAQDWLSNAGARNVAALLWRHVQATPIPSQPPMTLGNMRPNGGEVARSELAAPAFNALAVAQYRLQVLQSTVQSLDEYLRPRTLR